MSKGTISQSVIKRLPRYYRFLGQLSRNNVERISSRELSEKMGFTASQIRQDLNCFGGFGQQGYGYNVNDLHSEIAKILGVDQNIKTILIGAGNLGMAVTNHMDFKKRGCDLIGVFDNNPQLFEREVANHNIQSIENLEEFCKLHAPVIAILCIPKEAAQEIADRLIELGITAFWNFSHYDINFAHSERIVVENVHLGDSLQTLTFAVTNQNKEIAPKV